jgi:long-subunit acyl-CoA synthetase (AMP-forming)
MYPGNHAKPRANQAAFIMAQSGEAVTFAELEARTNRPAHFLRSRGLKRLDHYSIFMENNARYVECCGAGERSGLYFTCINSFLTADELAYIVNNSESKALIFSEAMRAVAVDALRQCPKIEVSRLWTDRATALVFSISTTRHPAFPPRRSRMSRPARRCCIHREPPAVRRASSGRYPNNHPRSNSRCSIFSRNCGVIAKG